MEESLFIRQQDLIKQKMLQNTAVTIIGAGAVGSFTALALAKMGANNIRVFDADVISLHNLPNQFYPRDSIGIPKVFKLRELIKLMTGIIIDAKPELYDDQFLDGIVITAVDNMVTRERAFDKACKDHVELFIDPRMGGQVFRIFLVHPKNPHENAIYRKSLYSDEEAQSDPCTAAAIIYNVLGITSHICNFVKKHINGESLGMSEFVFDYQNLDMLKIEQPSFDKIPEEAITKGGLI